MNVPDDLTRPADPNAPDLSGIPVGPYRLIREIGSGGMGTVFLAVRNDDAFQRRVAIKVLRRGMDTDAIVRRFRHERQILASLQHPYIAGLLDGGSTSDGLPYFAMEYVQGQNISDFCEARKLDTTARLELFRKVCAAVQYAHQNLIIHRDIKPANVLVTSDGTPKLLDFGIAKLLNPEVGGQTLAPTAAGLQLMTPDYASPEQVRGETVTTATDVYSLGVLLYELLTGRRPYELTSRSLADVAHVICHAEPERPSTAVTQPVGGATSPHTDRLRRRLAGDLDNIALKALSKEPDRRYASVDQFSEDVRRHLAGLPVIARKDTVGYRAAKFVRRNKGVVAAGAATLIVLIAGVVGTTWQARVASRERARAEQRFEAALAIHQKLVAEDPENDDFKQEVASDFAGLAAAQAKSGDRPGSARQSQSRNQPQSRSLEERSRQYRAADRGRARAHRQGRDLHALQEPCRIHHGLLGGDPHSRSTARGWINRRDGPENPGRCARGTCEAPNRLTTVGPHRFCVTRTVFHLQSARVPLSRRKPDPAPCRRDHGADRRVHVSRGSSSKVRAPMCQLATAVCNLGLIPGELTGMLRAGVGFPMGDGLVCVTDPGRQSSHIFTSMFLHGGVDAPDRQHVVPVALRQQHRGLDDAPALSRVLSALRCRRGAGSGLAQPDSPIPMVGASGAISGVMGAYLVLYPRVRVFTLVILGFFVTTVALPAWVMLIYWMGIQVVSGLVNSLAAEAGGGVAFWAHVGGFVAGVVLIKVFARRNRVLAHENHGYQPQRVGFSR